ncbi:TetR/AcrR family transcriptional regulator [Planktotalea sp.]|uniref:TetR/AcrR family transcriptional regulator n=1 Tax=Planktotalea sp. TaxID=2029877 RepID=UPI00329772F6
MERTQYKKSSKTQDRILDVAEDLFSKQGFDATTTRQITAAAGVRTASVNYYFKTKRDLMIAVIDRRFDILRREREAMLANVDTHSGDQPTQIKAIVEAFVLPLAKLTKTDPVGWSNYNRIIAQLALNKELPHDTYAEKINKTAEKFIVGLKATSPNKSLNDVIEAYQFLLGAVLFAFTESDRFTQALNGNSQLAQAASNPKPLVNFISAGLVELFDPGQ